MPAEISMGLDERGLRAAGGSRLKLGVRGGGPDAGEEDRIVADTLVTDLRHFEGAGARSPGAALRLRAFLGRIVEAASAVPAGPPLQTAIPCRHARRKRAPCGGRIVAQRLDVPPEIRWICAGCGEEGVITGWRGGASDRRGAYARSGAGEAPDPRDIPRQVIADAAAAAGDPPSLEELNARIAERMDEYNLRPQPALGGLAPVQVWRLLHSDWTSPESALRVDETLSLDDLAGVTLVANARTFLRALLDAGGTRATQTGNLNRRFLAQFVESFVWPDVELEMILEYGKRMNETDLWSVHVIRVLLELAGLVARRKGTWRVTARGRRLLSDERAGELYARLLRTHFLELNLAYLGGGPEVHGLQPTIAYALYRFGIVASDWQGRDALVREILLPAVREEVPPREEVDVLPYVLEGRVLQPLEELGLATSRSIHPLRRDFTERVYRKTRLFDRVLRFEVAP